MPPSYAVLLSYTFGAKMVSLSRRERQRLCEKLEFLRAGLWDTGLRVKKLKGIGRPVFEARLNRGERILFTLRRPPGGNDEGHGVTRIHLRDLVPHEDVGRALSRIVKAPLLEIERAEVEEMSEFVADDLGDDYFWPALDRPVDAPPTDDAGPEPWLVVDEEELGRLQVVDQGDNLKLYLFLTSEQARLLHSEPPLLLSGTAGSGKTTIAVYFLLRQRVRQLAAAPDGAVQAATAPGNAERALFLTCSPHLKRFSERIYHGLVKATELEHAAEAVRFADAGRAAQ